MDMIDSPPFHRGDEPKLLPSFTKRQSAVSPKAKSAPQTTSQPMQLSESFKFDSSSHKRAHKAILKHQQTAMRKAPPGLQQAVDKRPKPRKKMKPSSNKDAAKRQSCNECRLRKIQCEAASESWNGGRCRRCKVAGVRCLFEGGSPSLIAASINRIADDDVLNDDGLNEAEDGTRFQSPLPLLKLIDTSRLNRSKYQSNATKEPGPLSIPENCLELQKAQDELERMEADRRVKEPARLKQRALIQKLQAESSANGQSQAPYYRPYEGQNEDMGALRSPNNFCTAIPASSMSLAFQNYEENLKIMFDMTKAQDTVENISMQTQIVAMLREKAMGIRSSCSLESSIYMEDKGGENVQTDTGFIRLQELDGQAIDIEDDREIDWNNPVAKRRRQNKARDEEASIALPVSRPTQMPRNVRIQKKLSVGEIASNVKTHVTFEMQSTRHVRKVNTTNKSIINKRALPPKRDNITRIRGNLSHPSYPKTDRPNQLSENNIRLFTAINSVNSNEKNFELEEDLTSEGFFI